MFSRIFIRILSPILLELIFCLKALYRIFTLFSAFWISHAYLKAIFILDNIFNFSVILLIRLTIPETIFLLINLKIPGTIIYSHLTDVLVFLLSTIFAHAIWQPFDIIKMYSIKNVKKRIRSAEKKYREYRNVSNDYRIMQKYSISSI